MTSPHNATTEETCAHAWWSVRGGRPLGPRMLKAMDDHFALLRTSVSFLGRNITPFELRICVACRSYVLLDWHLIQRDNRIEFSLSLCWWQFVPFSANTPQRTLVFTVLRSNSTRSIYEEDKDLVILVHIWRFEGLQGERTRTECEDWYLIHVSTVPKADTYTWRKNPKRNLNKTLILDTHNPFPWDEDGKKRRE